MTEVELNAAEYILSGQGVIPCPYCNGTGDGPIHHLHLLRGTRLDVAMSCHVCDGRKLLVDDRLLAAYHILKLPTHGLRRIPRASNASRGIDD